MNDHPVRVGSMLYTLVDPHRGHERAYNRWYERDHFYAGCMAGPWFFAGRRWVATRELKDLRFPVDSPVAAPVDKGSFLATYWVLEGKHDECWAWANDQVWHLYQQGRGFAKRDHAHSVLFDSPWSHYRDADPVPVELAFDHNYAGLVSVFVDCNESTTDDEFRAFLTAGPLAALMTPDSPVASCAAWTPLPRDPGVDGNAPMELGTPPGGEGRSLQLFFIDDDPRSCWDLFRRYAAEIDVSGMARVVFAAPFIPTVVGTDTYTDQLW